MPRARRTGRQAQAVRPTWVSPALAVLGLLVGAAMLWFGYPGTIATWSFLLAAGWVAPPAMLTGKKDSSGFPTAAHPGETKAMQRYRFWADLKWHLIFPTNAFLPGWPVYAAWIYGIWAAAAVWCLPHAGAGHVGSLPRHVDAAMMFFLVTQVAAARRRTVVAGDVSPGVRVDAIKHVKDADRSRLALGSLAALVAAAAGAFLASRYLPAPPLPAGSSIAWYVIGAVGGLGAAVARWWVQASLKPWRIVVAARAEWAPRWQMLKHDPAPVLTARDKVGNATVDTFIAPGSMGAMAYWSLAPKVTPTMGAGQRIAILSTPNTDSQGQPQPGTRHPLQFQVVYWPADALPDVTGLDTDPDEVRLYIQCSMVWACDESGYARPILDEVIPVALTNVEAPEIPDSGEHDDSPADPDGYDAAPGAQPSARQAWATTWLLPDGPPIKYVRTVLAPSVAGYLGCEVLTDHRHNGGQGAVYVGGLTDGSTVFDANTGVTDESLMRLANEDVWNNRWSEVLKQDVNPPTIEHSTYKEAQLANGRTVFQQAFVTLRGVDPMDFFGHEAKIKATLDGAPFVSVTGWPSDGRGARRGERHPQAFTVRWSKDAAPANPDTLAPTGRDETAAKWVLSGRMNEAFKAARLAAPEVYEANCLTVRRSPGHIWQIKIRLYGGVTLSDVRGASQRLRQSLGSEWLRVEAVADGCVIVAGVSPAKAVLINPERDERYLASLDWEQAFLDAKVNGVGGLTPTLLEVDSLPNNEQVQVLDFDLPSGLAFVDVKAKSRALETSSKNAFVEVRRHPSGKADVFRILASEVNPMPERAQFDFEAAETGDHRIPFATNLFGEATCYDNKLDPMLLVVGMAGGGKSVALQNIIYGAVIRGWDLWVADPAKGGVDFQFSEVYSRAFARTIWETKGMIQAIYAEVQRRKAINAQYNCGNYRDLPDEVRYNHTLIVLDEFTSMMMPEPVPKALDDSEETLRAVEAAKAINAARAYVGTYVGKIVREARSTGFTMLLATQALKADTLAKIPGANDLKDNMSRMIMGRASFGQLQAALKMPTEAPEQPDVLPPGRGMYEGNSKASETIQVWFEASQDVFGQHLAERVAPVAPERRLDLSVFVEPDLEVDGARFDHETRRPVAHQSTEPVITDLGSFDLDLGDLDLDLDDDAEEHVPDAGTVTVYDHATWDEIDPSRWMPEVSAYGWTEVDAVLGFLDEFPDIRAIVWTDQSLDVTAASGQTFREIVTSLFAERGVALLNEPPAAAPAAVGPSGEPDLEFDWAMDPASTTETGDDVTDGSDLEWSGSIAAEPQGSPDPTVVDWDAVDHSDWAPSATEYGWTSIDALVEYLGFHPDVRTVIWADPRLDVDDETGVPHRAVVLDLLATRGVALADPGAPVVEPSPASPQAPAVQPAATPSVEDEFGDLPKVPAHLLPNDDPFA